MNEVKIRIYKVLNNESKDLYRNSVKVPVGESFPFNDFTKIFRMLYPDCFIQYNIF